MHPLKPDLANNVGGSLTFGDVLPMYNDPLDSLRPDSVEEKVVNDTKCLFNSMITRLLIAWYTIRRLCHFSSSTLCI